MKRISASRKGFKEGVSESDKRELEKQLKREKSGSKEPSESAKQELKKLASLEFYICTSCLEQFPNLAMSANSTECLPCSFLKKLNESSKSVNLEKLLQTAIEACIK